MNPTFPVSPRPSARTRPLPDLRGLGWGRGETDRLGALARAAWVAVGMVGLFAVALAGGLGLYAYGHADRVYEGVTVAGVPVGGMTEAEATRALETRFAAYAQEPIVVRAGGQEFRVTPAQAGARPDAARSAAAAFAYGRGGAVWGRSARWMGGLLGGAAVAPRVEVDGSRLDAALGAWVPAVIRPAEDARVEMGGERPVVVPEVPGVGFDLGASRARLAAAFGGLDGRPVDLVTPPIPAAVTAAMVAPGLAGAEVAVAGELRLGATEGTWRLAPEDLRRIVSVGPDGEVEVAEGPIRELVGGIARAIDHPSADAGIAVGEDGSLGVVPGVESAAVDVDATVTAAVGALRAGTGGVDVVVARAAPEIVDGEAEAALVVGEALIADGMGLTWEEEEFELGRADLLRALVIEADPGAAEPFGFRLDPEVLAAVLEPVAAAVDEPARDARFRVVDGRVEVVAKEADGREVDVAASVEGMLEELGDGKRTSGLVVEELKPAHRAAERARIRVPEEVLADAATSYVGSSEPRRLNVERAAALEDGWLVPPGGVFSYVENVGRVDERNGFVTGFGIVADEERGGVTTAPVVGGGICQVSTTIFQAAFWAGMPIVERYAHPYWLTSYGEAPRGMKGLDAMVNIEEDWALDLKFRNATEDWMLVSVVADGANVTARILGTDPGWDVAVEGPAVSAVVPSDPAMHYTDSPELPRGQELLVERAQEGFDASIRRVVTDRDGRVVDDFTLASSYAPARNTTLRGTG